jgi:uncharacterized membrane protein YesL
MNRLTETFIIKGSTFLVNLFLLNTILVIGTVLSFGLLFIPITVGIFYIFRKVITKEDYYFWKDFYLAIRNNLKVSLVVSLLFEVLGYFLWVNLTNINFQSNAILSYGLAAIVAYGMFIIWIYGSTIIARFNVTPKRVVKFAFLIGNVHVLTTLTGLIFLGIMISLYFLFNYLMIFIFITLYLFLMSIPVFNLLKRYEPK